MVSACMHVCVCARVHVCVSAPPPPVPDPQLLHEVGRDGCNEWPRGVQAVARADKGVGGVGTLQGWRQGGGVRGQGVRGVGGLWVD